jgi:rhamnogalacturonyl hydrolase YesR
MKKNKIFLLVAALSVGMLFSACEDNLTNDDPKPDTDGKEQPDTISYNLDIFPVGSKPEEVGAKVTELFIKSPHSFWGSMTSTLKADHLTYPDVCAWLGAFWFSQATHNDELYNKLVDKFELLFTTEKNLQPSLTPSASNKVDYYVFGALPLEIYKRRQEEKYLNLGMKYADGQWTLPSNATQAQTDWHNDGYSWQTRLWIDDMFMITALQAQAYLVTGDEKYIERTAREMVLYLDRLQRDNGLFYHALNAPYYWGRGNGWFAVGMTELLRMLPADERYDVYRTRIMEGYLKMMEGLLRYQIYDGMWGQLIDNMSSWRETSGTAMFTYAMITGVKYGWLDKVKYGKAARKAWLALQTYLTDDYNLRNVCEGTGERNDYQYYLDRRKLTGDLHGQAAFLWCAYALTNPVSPQNNK